MKYAIDPEYTKTCFRELVNVPSPVGYYEKMNPVIERIAADLGHGVSYDNKSTAYLTLEGQDNTKTVEVMAHLDTIGLIIRGIDPDGKIRLSIKRAADRPASPNRPGPQNRPSSSYRASSPRPASEEPVPAPAGEKTGKDSLDDMLKRFMSESNANLASAGGKNRSGYERRSAKKPGRRNYDD